MIKQRAKKDDFFEVSSVYSRLGVALGALLKSSPEHLSDRYDGVEKHGKRKQKRKAA